MELGLLTGLIHLATLSLVPELKIVADREVAWANLDLDPAVRRTVI